MESRGNFDLKIAWLIDSRTLYNFVAVKIPEYGGRRFYQYSEDDFRV